MGLAYPVFKQYDCGHLEIKTAQADLLYHFHQDGWVEQVPVIGNHSFDVRQINHPDAWVAVLVFRDQIFYFTVQPEIFNTLVNEQKVMVQYTQPRFHSKRIAIVSANFDK